MRPFRLGTAWTVVAGMLLLGMVAALFGHVRLGGWIMGFGLFAGAFMRATLPERFVTDISVRSRTTDIVGYGVFGAAVLVVVSTLKL